MKKIIALLLAVVMVFALVACASTAKTDDTAAETTPAEADISLYYISVHCPVLLCFQRFSARAAQMQVPRGTCPFQNIIS